MRMVTGLILLMAPASAGWAQSVYQQHIRPVLEKQCLVCHNPTARQAGLDLSTREKMLRGGERGPAVVPGDVGESLLYAYITHKKQPGMRLYKGDFGADKLDWTLTDAQEKEIPFCDRDKASREKCKRCERLANMVKKIKPGKKPNSNEYFAKRHVWENGKLYFYSSGSSQVLFSQEQLDDCADYLAGSANGQALLAEVDEAKAEWKDRIGEYYTYQLKDFGWFNIDRTVPDKVVAFKGRIIDKDGMALEGAEVRLYCKDKDMRVHIRTVAKDGSYSGSRSGTMACRSMTSCSCRWIPAPASTRASSTN